MRSWRSRHQPTSSPWASGTATSYRSRTRRSSRSSSRRGAQRLDTPTPARCVSSRGNASCPVTLWSPAAPPASCSSRTARARAGAARETGRSRRRSTRPGWRRSSSTCWTTTRLPTGRTCSTSRFSRARLEAAHRFVQRDRRRSRPFRSATSARRPEPRPRSGPPPSSEARSRPWSRAGAGPTSPSPRLAAVRAPTLLIVGSRDEVVLELNEQAAAELQCEHEIVVVPGATHLFEEPGALEAVCRSRNLGGSWCISPGEAPLGYGPVNGREAQLATRRGRAPAAARSSIASLRDDARGRAARGARSVSRERSTRSSSGSKSAAAGYNLFVAGSAGLGSHGTILDYLERLRRAERRT